VVLLSRLPAVSNLIVSQYSFVSSLWLTSQLSHRLAASASDEKAQCAQSSNLIFGLRPDSNSIDQTADRAGYRRSSLTIASISRSYNVAQSSLSLALSSNPL